jgi:ribonuclease HIII
MTNAPPQRQPPASVLRKQPGNKPRRLTSVRRRNKLRANANVLRKQPGNKPRRLTSVRRRNKLRANASVLRKQPGNRPRRLTSVRRRNKLRSNVNVLRKQAVNVNWRRGSDKTRNPVNARSREDRSLEFPMTSHTAPLTPAQVEILRMVLRRDGFDFETKEHALFAARKGKLNVTIYQKGPKVLIQGKDTEDFIRFTLEPQILGEARLGYEEIVQPELFEPHFGIDESGKGDFFGPLVIAGAYTDATITRQLMDAGIMDSKRITSAARIRQLAAIIRATQGCRTAVVAIGPERYNALYQSFGNLNQLLAWGHARVIANLAAAIPNCARALSDQFANPRVLQRALRQTGLTITLEQRTKGESDIAVAAASIIARERFIDWIDKTSAACGISLPLGASAAVVQAGRDLIARLGQDALTKTAKLHFRTTSAVIDATPPGPPPE